MMTLFERHYPASPCHPGKLLAKLSACVFNSTCLILKRQNYSVSLLLEGKDLTILIQHFSLQSLESLAHKQ